MARKAAMDIINQGMEISIGVSNNQRIILSKFHLINISRASLMSRDGRVMTTCGDMRQGYLYQMMARELLYYTANESAGLIFGSA